MTGSSERCFSPITPRNHLKKKTKEKVMGFSWGFQLTTCMMAYGCHCARPPITCFVFLNKKTFVCSLKKKKKASYAYKIYSTTHQIEHLKSAHPRWGRVSLERGRCSLFPHRLTSSLVSPSPPTPYCTPHSRVFPVPSGTPAPR